MSTVTHKCILNPTRTQSRRNIRASFIYAGIHVLFCVGFGILFWYFINGRQLKCSLFRYTQYEVCLCVCFSLFVCFSKTEASPSTAKKTISSKPTESLFSDKEEEQDLFSSSQNLGNAPPSIKPAAAATAEGEEEKQKPKKKRPAGAVPMFGGGGGGDMFGEIGRSKKSAEGGKSEPQVSSR